MKREKAALWIVGLLPRWIVYWCAIRLFGEVTTGPLSDREVPSISIGDALRAWDGGGR